MSETSAAGWEPVPGIDGPAERIELDTLDFLDDLSHPLRGRMLRLLRDPKSIAELAAALSVPVTRLYHHRDRLEAAGLIRVVATRKVAAVTERRYQIVSRAFGAAPEFFESRDESEVATALGAVFDMAKLGLQREVETGVVRLDDDNNDTVLELLHLTLAPARKEELTKKLEALLAEFSSDDDRHDPDASAFVLFVAAHPETD